MFVCALDWQESCHEFEQLVIVQCEALIQLIQERREFLLETLQMDKDNKLRILKVGRAWRAHEPIDAEHEHSISLNSSRTSTHRSNKLTALENYNRRLA